MVPLWTRAIWPLVCPRQGTCMCAWCSAQHWRHPHAHVVLTQAWGPGVAGSLDSISAASAVLSRGFPQVSAGAVACVQNHCISGFMGHFGGGCGEKLELRLICHLWFKHCFLCFLFLSHTVHTQRQESGGGREAGDSWEDCGAPGGLLQP